MRALSATRGAQGGVMLLEALVAILIFSIGIIAVMGMQAASISSVTQAKFRTDASYLANQIIARMWVDQGNLASYATPGSAGRSAWDATVTATLPQGAGAIAIAGTQATVTITWRMPNETVTRKYVTQATVNSSTSP